MFILKLARLNYQDSFYWLFLLKEILQTLIQKRLNQLKKHVYFKIIKTPLILSIVYFKISNIKIYSK